MALFLVIDRARWGFSHNVVRANSPQDAARLAGAAYPHRSVEVIPLPLVGEPGLLWCHDESPDTPRD